MERDEYADMFQYQIGQTVRWAEYPGERLRIFQRRWTQRELLAPLVTYRLKPQSAGLGLICLDHGWVREADLQACQEPS
jgi:hypothetical protein